MATMGVVGMPGLLQAGTRFAFAVASARSWVTVVSHQVELPILTKLCRAARCGIGSELILGTSALEQLREGPALASLLSAGVEVWHHVGEMDGRLAISERVAVFRAGEPFGAGGQLERGVEVRAEDRRHAQFFTQYVVGLRAHCRLVEPGLHHVGEAGVGGGDGFCIRCGKSIPLGAPYCRNDYGSWALEGDPEQVEIHCHACGLPFEATRNRPLCECCVSLYARHAAGGALC